MGALILGPRLGKYDKAIQQLRTSRVRHEETDIRVIASDTGGLTGSDLERVAVEAAKQMVLAHRDAVVLDDLMFGLKRQRQRISLAQTCDH